MGRALGGIDIDWSEIFCRVSSSPERADAFYPGSAPAAQGAAAAKGDDEPRRGDSSRRHHPGSDGYRSDSHVIKINWAEVFGTRSPSPDRADALYPGSAPAAQAGGRGGEVGRQAAAGSFDPPPPPLPLPSRVEAFCPAAIAAAFARCPRPPRAGRRSTRPRRKTSMMKGEVTLHPLRRDHASLILRKKMHFSTCLVKSTDHFKPLRSLLNLYRCQKTSPEEIFEALKGIPRLARADLLRAYSMLTQDDRRFRSLMALPKNMRKEWLLMEIGSI